MTYEDMMEYVKKCKLYPNGKIVGPDGRVVGGVDMDSDAWEELMKGYNSEYSCTIVDDQ